MDHEGHARGAGFANSGAVSPGASVQRQTGVLQILSDGLPAFLS